MTDVAKIALVGDEITVTRNAVYRIKLHYDVVSPEQAKKYDRVLFKIDKAVERSRLRKASGTPDKGSI